MILHTDQNTYANACDAAGKSALLYNDVKFIFALESESKEDQRIIGKCRRNFHNEEALEKTLPREMVTRREFNTQYCDDDYVTLWKDDLDYKFLVVYIHSEVVEKYKDLFEQFIGVIIEGTGCEYLLDKKQAAQLSLFECDQQ